MGNCEAIDEGALLEGLKSASASVREAVFNRVFEALHERVFSLCRHLTQSTGEAEDATQECFLAIHRALPGFRGEARLSTWAYRIAIHAALRVKSRRGREMVPLEEALEHPAAGAGPEEAASAKQAARRLQSALEQLSEEHRAVLSLFALEGLDAQQIADVLGIPIGTVWSRLHTARKRLSGLYSG